MRQYKLVQGPFPAENVFTGEIGRLKSYEKQKPYVDVSYFLNEIELFDCKIDHTICVIHT